jgi:hypothetical protein
MDVPKTGFLRRVLGAERAGRVRRLTRSILQTGRRRLGRGGVQGERASDIIREGGNALFRRGRPGR